MSTPDSGRAPLWARFHGTIGGVPVDNASELSAIVSVLPLPFLHPIMCVRLLVAFFRILYGNNIHAGWRFAQLVTRAPPN